ncbi:hypothetical protein O4G98_01145 [Zoogloeaceae bacterium G21618-S1]|nr:hypothetical protein [Zoogloeaceae bacterium G21618-S1]
MRVRTQVAIITLTIASHMLHAENQMTNQLESERSVSSVHGMALDGSEIKRLASDALDGSGDAARRLALHFLVAQGDREEGLYWAIIAAENGDIIGQYNTGFLLKDDPDPRNRQRAIYWLKRAKAAGNDAAQSLLEELGIDKK